MSEDRPEVSYTTRRQQIRRERIFIFGLGGLLILLIVAGLFFAISVTDADRRNAVVFPRNLDVWYVYPNRDVRFATLEYPADYDAKQEEGSVQMAGPLISDPGDVKSEEALNATINSSSIATGPGQDSALLFPLYDLNLDSGKSAYGVDVTTSGSPYLIDSDTSQLLQLGVGDVSGYAQVIVAVALPHDTSIIDIPSADIQPYREVQNLGGWHIFYFETTVNQSAEAIRIEFALGNKTPGNLSPFRVDRRR
jgi:hypothetical protein